MKIMGHTASTGIEMHANKLADNTEGNKPSDRYTHKYNNNIKLDVQIWPGFHKVQNSVSWRVSADRTMDLHFPWKAGWLSAS